VFRGALLEQTAVIHRIICQHHWTLSSLSDFIYLFLGWSLGPQYNLFLHVTTLVGDICFIVSLLLAGDLLCQCSDDVFFNIIPKHNLYSLLKVEGKFSAAKRSKCTMYTSNELTFPILNPWFLSLKSNKSHNKHTCKTPINLHIIHKHAISIGNLDFDLLYCARWMICLSCSDHISFV
jgi:hypothetical protein